MLSSADSHQHAIASIVVNHGGSDEASLYVSLDYIPWTHPLQKFNYYLHYTTHIESTLAAAPFTWRNVYIEIPNSPYRKTRKWRS